MNPRVGWADLPKALRDAIESHVGEFVTEEPVSTGHNCLIGMRLTTAAGVYFLKGVPADRAPAVRTQRYEQLVSPFVGQISARLAFHLDAEGWNVLGFDFLDGYRHADLSPGSEDLPRIAATLRVLALVGLPEGTDVRRAEQRYATYAGRDSSPFAGTTLCHTDLHKHNILIKDGEREAKLVDWAWPTAGAPWIDTACLILQLIEAGHTPKNAETWAEDIAPFRRAPQDHVSLFVIALKNLWEEISAADPQQWKADVATAARDWAAHRGLG